MGGSPGAGDQEISTATVFIALLSGSPHLELHAGLRLEK
jgi:hypothetical protein